MVHLFIHVVNFYWAPFLRSQNILLKTKARYKIISKLYKLLKPKPEIWKWVNQYAHLLSVGDKIIDAGFEHAYHAFKWWWQTAIQPFCLEMILGLCFFYCISVDYFQKKKKFDGLSRLKKPVHSWTILCDCQSGVGSEDVLEDTEGITGDGKKINFKK